MKLRCFPCRFTSVLVMAAAAGMPLVVDADIVTLKSGTKIECEVIGYNAGKLSLRKPDGKIITGSISTVSEIQFSRLTEPPAEPEAVSPAAPADSSPETQRDTIPLAVAPDAPPDAPPDASPAAEDTNGPSATAVAEPLEAEPVAPAKPVREYGTVYDIIRALPTELQPHKEAWKKNPLMLTKMEDWFRDNAIGSRLSLPPRELLGIDTEGWLTVELREFSVGTVKYKCDDGIRCRYLAAIPENPEKDRELLKALAAEGKALSDYIAEKDKEKSAINARLLKLKIGKRDEKGRAIRRGSRVVVSGIVRDFQATAFMDATPPYVTVAVELVDAEIKE